MKIAHLCLSCFYIDGRSYQENELVRQHILDGHEVLVLASTETHDQNGEIAYIDPCVYIGQEGSSVIRLPYRGWPARVARKLRIHSGVYDILTKFQPDAILFHGACGWEAVTVARYVRDNPGTKFYIDSHEDWNNSARNWLSRELLHKIYYRYCLSRALDVVGGILCVSMEIMDFVKTVYKVPTNKLEYFPLGGHPVPMDEYVLRRSRARDSLGIAETDILFIQSGKQTSRKKLIDSLRAFLKIKPSNAKFIIAGTLHADIVEEAQILIASDSDVTFLGWKNVEDLTDLLCGADVYLQPGTQSVTMQHGLCCHCAVVLDDTPAHHYYVHENGWLINDNLTLEMVFKNISHSELPLMMRKSYEFAKENLSYKVLAQRVLR